MSKFSSFKEHQLITESWRGYLNEEQAVEGELEEQSRPEDQEVAKLVQLVVSGKDGGAQARELLLSLDIGNELARQYTVEQVILGVLQRSDRFLAAAPQEYPWPEYRQDFARNGFPQRRFPWDTDTRAKSESAQAWYKLIAGLLGLVQNKSPGEALSWYRRAADTQGSGRTDASSGSWAFVMGAAEWRDNPEETLQNWLSAWKKSQGS